MWRSLRYQPIVRRCGSKLIERAEQRLYDVAETGRFGGGFETFDSALSHAIGRAAQAYQSDGNLSGLLTRLRDLDAKTGGLQPSDLIIIAGRPGTGKTALATNVAYNVASSYQPALRRTVPRSSPRSRPA